MASDMATLLLYPGAGSSRDHSSLVRDRDHATAGRGSTVDVQRHDFPYRREGRKAPDRAPKLLAVDPRRPRRHRPSTRPVVMGGRSMGGRMTTMVAADVDGGGPVARLAGLVLICYPLHPPGKPDAAPVEHLPAIDVPCLFISGTNDPFGAPDELERWTATIPAPVTHLWIERKGHDLQGRRRRASPTRSWPRRPDHGADGRAGSRPG